MAMATGGIMAALLAPHRRGPLPSAARNGDTGGCLDLAGNREEPMANLFDSLPARLAEETFTELLTRPGVRIERIVSTGHVTPAGAPYDQDHDEWVLLLRGSARLWIEGTGERDLRPGDHLLIPARCLHSVTHTAADGPTVWLAVHFG